MFWKDYICSIQQEKLRKSSDQEIVKTLDCNQFTKDPVGSPLNSNIPLMPQRPENVKDAFTLENVCEPYWRIFSYIGFGNISAQRCNDYRQQKLAKALLLFNTVYSDKNKQDAGARRRNEIQGRLLVASDQRCNVYLNFLQTQQSDGKYALGLGSIITGGLGAVFTEAAVTRPLAGASSIFSGWRAEFENQYFINQATYTIADAIKQRRQRLLEEIYANSGRSQKVLRETIDGLALAKLELNKATDDKGVAQKELADAKKKTDAKDITDKTAAFETAEKNFELAQARVDFIKTKLVFSTDKPRELRIVSLNQYPVYDAINDAIKYHEACTVTSGFAELNKALKDSKSPGLDAMKETLTGIKDLQNTIKDIAANGNLSASSANK